jgi:hypothetical protein
LNRFPDVYTQKIEPRKFRGSFSQPRAPNLVIFGPLALTAIVLAILDKLLWLAAVFVALPSANLLLGMIPLILFTIGVMIYGAAP